MASILLVFDSRVKDYSTIINQFLPDTSYLILDSSSDGLMQMSEYLNRTGERYDSIQIISHGAPGLVMLGNATLSNGNIALYQPELSVIGSALQDDGDLLFYGCNVGAGVQGHQFIETLSQMTGGDVAASDDLTGGKVAGGDWELEITTGKIETMIPFTNATLQQYDHTLGYAETQDYMLAKMSLVAYYDNPFVPTEEDLTKKTIAENAWDELYRDGWRILVKNGSGDYVPAEDFCPMSPTDEHEDYAATAFKKDDTIVIAYRGTDSDFPNGDWVGADLAIAGIDADDDPDWDYQFEDAIDLAFQLLKQYKDNLATQILVTGHSLGGALAEVVSKLFNLSGTTFDPGGAENIAQSTTYHDYALIMAAYYENVLSESSHYAPFAAGPGAGFTNYLIKDSIVSHEPEADHIGTDIIELISPETTQGAMHYMGGILELMRERANAGGVEFYGTYNDDDISPSIIEITTGNHDNIFYGYAGNDTIDGVSGNDTLSGGGGNDTIDGGDGSDIVVLSGNFLDYIWDVDQSTSSFVLTDTFSMRDGTDFIINVENFQFDDGIKSVSHFNNSYNSGQGSNILVNGLGGPCGFGENYLARNDDGYVSNINIENIYKALCINGDDVEALVYTINLAMEYRQTFHTDVFIDILCYRKYGHNEGD
ncbi:MAG: DUF4347 domain-containing protein, partial [Geobacteraceae bacterium]|nr:DUF4347 domain-containing protein [Geobacteraceae bacterium]